MARVVHFEFPADDLERAIKFYEGVFGWGITKWPGPVDYWLVQTGEASEAGIDGGITRRSDFMTSTVNTIDVTSLDDVVEKIVAHGGQVLAPKMPVPGVGYMAYCQDTEGNIFGLMQADPTAA